MQFLAATFGPARRSRRTAALILAALLLATVVAPVAAGPAPAPAAGEQFPESIPLPIGFRPEGITIGYGTTFFVGSIPTGDIYRGDLRTGEGSVFIDAPDGRAAIGMKLDERTGYLFVAGGPTGKGFVYDARTGADVAEYLFDAEGAFINDVTLTRHGAWFTNSGAAELYLVPQGPGGRLADTHMTLPLTGEWVQPPPGGFGANGIVATPDGRTLIVINSAQQTLYNVDIHTGYATAIDVGQPLPNGDGLWLQGHTLWVVQNRLNQVSVIKLNQDYTAGEVVDVITSPLFRVPTTIAPFGQWFYAVNARFGIADPNTADYDIVRFEKR